MENCIFCKIINQEIPSAKVYEDDKVYAFLDLSQVTPGHTLLVPKKHVENIFEYDQELAAETAARIPKIARAIQVAFPDSKGMNIINNNGKVAYQSVFHSHWHLVPRYSDKDDMKLTFSSNQDNFTQEEFQERAEKITNNIKE